MYRWGTICISSAVHSQQPYLRNQPPLFGGRVKPDTALSRPKLPVGTYHTSCYTLQDTFVILHHCTFIFYTATSNRKTRLPSPTLHVQLDSTCPYSFLFVAFPCYTCFFPLCFAFACFPTRTSSHVIDDRSRALLTHYSLSLYIHTPSFTYISLFRAFR